MCMKLFFRSTLVFVKKLIIFIYKGLIRFIKNVNKHFFLFQTQNVFFFVKNDQKSIFEQVHNQHCSKLSPYFSPIQNGFLIIMFSNLSGTGRFFAGDSSIALRHYITSANIKKLSRLVGYRSEDPAGDRTFIAFSHSS